MGSVVLENQNKTTLLPELKTPLPGPKTAALIAQDTEFVSPSYPRPYPLSVAKGEGCMITDLDGNRFLDLNAGIAVSSTGHSHPEVVDAIRQQAGEFLHMAGMEFYYPQMTDLCERLAKSVPGPSPKKVFLCNSGTEAVEGAMKLARYATGRTHFISFFRGFHGRTFGSMALTASRSSLSAQYAPLMPGVYYAHFPNPYRSPFTSVVGRQDSQKCIQDALDYIENYLFKMVVNPDEVAAFILEPIQGEGGYIVPPVGFLTALKKLAEKQGILVIADEVQSGVGRTGKLWAVEHEPGFEPDILTTAKGIASGLPLGAFIAKADLMTWPQGAHASTFGGNPVSCVAALKTLDLIENGLMQHAHQMGDRLRAGLRTLMAKHDVIGDVRGYGLMIGVEFVENRQTHQPNPTLRNNLVQAFFQHGLLILGCGDSSIRFSPPLVIQAEQVDFTLQKLDELLSELAS
jgi:4-aminobutyrate aminotransferase